PALGAARSFARPRPGLRTALRFLGGGVDGGLFLHGHGLGGRGGRFRRGLRRCRLCLGLRFRFTSLGGFPLFLLDRQFGVLFALLGPCLGLCFCLRRGLLGFFFAFARFDQRQLFAVPRLFIGFFFALGRFFGTGRF